MSGHSHYATIKRQKEAKDAAKGKIFSKHAKAIAIAIKTGGGADPEMNSKLRFAIDQAKTDNMPRVNIDRILSRAEEAGRIEEVTYEGYGPEGIAVVVEAATDNRNRTSQEIKNIFERVGGSLAGPGAVSFNFEPRGLMIINKEKDVSSQMLKLIDFGVEDLDEVEDGIEAYVSVDKLSQKKEELEKEGFVIQSFEPVLKPKNYLKITEKEKAKKALTFLDLLEEHDDVQNVHSNIDIPQEVLEQISS